MAQDLLLGFLLFARDLARVAEVVVLIDVSLNIALSIRSAQTAGYCGDGGYALQRGAHFHNT